MGQYSSVKPRARLLSKELLLAFAKMIYPVHVSQAILNSKTTDFLVALHFLKMTTRAKQLCKKHLVTVAMATERSPIKVPCENEDLPDKENAPDFDEDTLRGEL